MFLANANLPPSMLHLHHSKMFSRLRVREKPVVLSTKQDDSYQVVVTLLQRQVENKAMYKLANLKVAMKTSLQKPFDD
jgi:hypothetical protein